MLCNNCSGGRECNYNYVPVFLCSFVCTCLCLCEVGSAKYLESLSYLTLVLLICLALMAHQLLGDQGKTCLSNYYVLCAGT